MRCQPPSLRPIPLPPRQHGTPGSGVGTPHSASLLPGSPTPSELPTSPEPQPPPSRSYIPGSAPSGRRQPRLPEYTSGSSCNSGRKKLGAPPVSEGRCQGGTGVAKARVRGGGLGYDMKEGRVSGGIFEGLGCAAGVHFLSPTYLSGTTPALGTGGQV